MYCPWEYTYWLGGKERNQAKGIGRVLVNLFIEEKSDELEVHADSTDSLTYSQLAESTDEWTNMTLEGMAFYISSDIVEHNNSVYDGLQGNLIMDPWNFIINKATEELFFDTLIWEGTYNVILTISVLGKEKTQYYHNPSADSENLLFFVQNIYDRLLGGNHDIIAWPYDMRVMTLFSYPAQYSVTTSFIRGYDGLYLYHVEKLRLLVSDSDLFVEYSAPHNGTILYVEDQELELNPSGNTVDVNFITFSIGGYRTVDFHFYVFLESGVYLHFAPS